MCVLPVAPVWVLSFPNGGVSQELVLSLPFSDIIEPGDPCSACEKQYTFRGSKKGIFTSPDFPNEYSDRTTCCYFFHAADDGRVKIEFDYFDLEEPSDNG